MEMGLMKQVKKKLMRELYTLFTLSLSTLSLLFFSYYYLGSLSTLLHNVLNNNSNSFKNSKAIFFVCNAIVVFLAKESGLLTPSTAATTSDFHGEFAAKKENHHVLEKSKLVGQFKEQDLEIEEEEEKVMELVVVGGGGEEKELEEINGVALEIVNGVEEFEEDEGVDELNRRVEEFIKKVRREIREEALYFGLELKRRTN